MNISDDAAEKEDSCRTKISDPINQSCEKVDMYSQYIQKPANQDDAEEGNNSKYITKHLVEVEERGKFQKNEGDNSKRILNIDNDNMGSYTTYSENKSVEDEDLGSMKQINVQENISEQEGENLVLIV